mmetsp:Transcript_10232/g.23648  ORF Transcript_10232/g.23648 Transcript_10232/m.23648 type:complete len:374 (-) Transcript_10232:228-1349(-)
MSARIISRSLGSKHSASATLISRTMAPRSSSVIPTRYSASRPWCVTVLPHSNRHHPRVAGLQSCMSTTTMVPESVVRMVASNEATSCWFTARHVSGCWLTAKQSIQTNVSTGALRRNPSTVATSFANEPRQAWETKWEGTPTSAASTSSGQSARRRSPVTSLTHLCTTSPVVRSANLATPSIFPAATAVLIRLVMWSRPRSETPRWVASGRELAPLDEVEAAPPWGSWALGGLIGAGAAAGAAPSARRPLSTSSEGTPSCSQAAMSSRARECLLWSGIKPSRSPRLHLANCRPHTSCSRKADTSDASKCALTSRAHSSTQDKSPKGRRAGAPLPPPRDVPRLRYSGRSASRVPLFMPPLRFSTMTRVDSFWMP